MASIKYSVLLVIASIAVPSVTPLVLPSYIKPCKIDDNLDACALKHGNEVIPRIVKGDPKYRVPVLDPFQITELVIDSSSSKSVQMKLNLTNLKVFGVKDSKFVGSKMDVKAKHIEWEVEAPVIQIEGDYTVNGKFLILPIQGKGPGTIKIENLKGKIIFDYDLVKKKGDDYIKLGKFDIKYTTTRLHVRLENLFNGEKTLNDEMNRALDENWEELNRELGPPVSEAIAVIFKQIFNNIIELVPYKNFFDQ